MHTYLRQYYDLMTRVDKISYGAATVDVPGGELGWGDAQNLGEKDNEMILPFYSCTISVHNKKAV